MLTLPKLHVAAPLLDGAGIACSELPYNWIKGIRKPLRKRDRSLENEGGIREEKEGKRRGNRRN